jgi:hypothetical protein
VNSACATTTHVFSLVLSTLALLTDPNVAMVPVPDPRFKVLCQKYAPKSEVPPVVTVTDIAGLVKVLTTLSVQSLQLTLLKYFTVS